MVQDCDLQPFDVNLAPLWQPFPGLIKSPASGANPAGKVFLTDKHRDGVLIKGAFDSQT